VLILGLPTTFLCVFDILGGDGGVVLGYLLLVGRHLGLRLELGLLRFGSSKGAKRLHGDTGDTDDRRDSHQ